MATKIDYSKSWSDALAMLSAHKQAVIALAGVLVFLPSLLLSQFVAEPVLEGVEDSQVMMQIYSDWFSANAGWILLSTLLSAFGGLCILVVLLRHGSMTVGAAMASAAALFLTYLAAYLLVGIVSGIGLIFLILPGIYLFIKFILTGPVVAAEDEKNPITAMRRSWGLTKGNSLRIFGFILILAIVAIVTAIALGAIIGIVFSLVLPTEAALFLTNIVEALVGAVFAVIFLAVYASLYRQLAGHSTEDLRETF